MPKKLFFVLIILFSNLITARTIYVNLNATGINDGTSWANAYTDLQNAINNAVSGDEIWVAKGTYHPTRPADNLNVIDPNNRNNSFVLKDNVKLYGGFIGNESLLTQRNWNLNRTVLSGDIGVSNDDSDNSYHVVIVAFSSSTEITHVDGFTITKGNATGSSGTRVNGQLTLNYTGGAAFCINGSLYFKNIIITENSGVKTGGLELDTTNINAENIQITYNKSTATSPTDGSAGGFYFYSSTFADSVYLIFNNFEISNNYSLCVGGGLIENYNSDTSFNNGTINDNISAATSYSFSPAPPFVGALRLTAKSATISNVSIQNNKSTLGSGNLVSTSAKNTFENINCSNNQGGGMFLFEGENKLNKLIIKNNGKNQTGGIRIVGFVNKITTLTNSIIQGNSGTFVGGISISKAVCNIDNVLISGNKSDYQTGGISIEDHSQITLNSSTITSNENVNFAIERFSYSQVTINNSILYQTTPIYIWESTVTINNSNFPPSTNFNGTNNIFLDPQFINPLPAGLSTSGDYRLQCNSPCKDTGNNSFLNPAIITDLDNNNRIIGASTDMGAYEYNGIPTPGLPNNSLTYCQNETASALTATGSNLLWYTTPTGGAGSTTAPAPATSVAGTTAYYVSQTIAGCESPRATITVEVKTPSALPTVTPTVNYCQNQIAAALSASGSNLLWYTNPTGGTGNTIAPTPNTSAAGTTTYYVTQNTNGCESARASITVTVGSAPAAPTVTSQITYCQNEATTALSALGTNLLWYTSATGGTGSTTAPTPNTSTPGVTTYYVTQTVGCESTRSAIVVTITATPQQPTVTSTITYCQNEISTALTATGSNLLWYTTPTGGTGSTTAPAPATNITGTTAYYVSQTVSDCESPRATITVEVKTPSALPTVTPTVNYCQNQIATALSASGSNLLWYTNPSGGTGNTIAPTPNTSAAGTTTYYVTQNTNGCESARASITVTVGSAPAAPTVTSQITYCQNQTAAALSATGNNLLWYTSATGGTGSTTAPTPNTSTPGVITYYVTQTVGCESQRSAIAVTVLALPTSVLPGGSICKDKNNSLLPFTITTNLDPARYSFQWYSIQSGNETIIPNAILNNLSVTAPGEYGVIIKDNSNTLGCESEMSKVTVGLENEPVSIAITQSEYFSENTSITVAVVPIGNYNYQLDNGVPQSRNLFTNVKPGKHIVTVSNTCGSITEEVLLVDYPKFFTPNGDGFNETWNIDALKDQPESSIEIFDRMGKLIKEIKPDGLGWDGTFNGKELPSTDYWFVVHYSDSNIITKTFKAHFTLKR